MCWSLSGGRWSEYQTLWMYTDAATVFEMYTHTQVLHALQVLNDTEAIPVNDETYNIDTEGL